MNTPWIKGAVVGAVVATGGGAVAGYNMMDSSKSAPPAFAEVLKVVPVTEQIELPREVCEEVEVTHRAEPKDKHRVLGTATGAVIGGVLGNKVGSGKTVATVIGAAAGGYAGNKIQERVQADDSYTTTETHCNTVADYEEKVIGYEVTFRIEDKEGHLRMDHHPGEHIPLNDGKLPADLEANLAQSS